MSPEIVAAIGRGQYDPSAVTPAEEHSLRQWAASEVRHFADRLRTLTEAGSHNQARRLQGKMMRSLGARLWALYETLPAAHGGSRDDHARRAARIAAILQRVATVGDMTRTPAPRVYKNPKPNGGHRYIMIFTWEEQARMKLLDQALTPFVGFHPRQYAIVQRPDGRGRTAACKALREITTGLTNDHVFFQVDVRNFFGSISHQWLEDNLALPPAYIRRFIHTGDMRIRSGGSRRARLSDEENNELGRLGIATGSAVSPRVAEIVMANILRSFAARRPDVRLVNYSDNLGVVCRRGEEAAIKDALRAVFRTHGAGPFQLTFSPSTPVTCENQFLGYNFQVRLGRTRFYLAAARVAAIRATARDITAANNPDFRRAERYVRGICASEHLWDGARAFGEEVLRGIEAYQTVHDDILARGPDVVHADLERARNTRNLANPAWRRWRPF